MAVARNDETEPDVPEPTPGADEDILAAAEPTEPVPGLAEDAVPSPESAPAAAPRPRARRGGFVPMLLGGAIAAGLGFGAATYVMPQLGLSGAPAADVATLKDGLARQATEIETLSKSVSSRPADPAVAELAKALEEERGKTATSLAALNDTLAGLDARLADTAARLETLEPRLAALEKRPVEGGAASATALDAFGREMAALRTEMAAQKTALAEAQSQVGEEAARATESVKAAAAEAEKLRAEAEETARHATARAAVGRIEAALSAGGALAPALADLDAAGVTVPPALAEQAQGVPTLDALREAFPPAARDALAVSLKETAAGSGWDRVFAFLRTQSGARSLTPREGTDPDAVLSRAEAALGAGDLSATIAEIGALPAGGQARMAEWVALAQRRIAATEAAAALAAEVK